MSTPTNNPEDLGIVVKDGVIAGTLGAAAMVARLMLSTEPVTLGWVIRRVSAAAITSIFVGWALADQISSQPLKFAAIGISGYTAPELLDYGLRYLKQRGENEIKKIKSEKGKKRKRK